MCWWKRRKKPKPPSSNDGGRIGYHLIKTGAAEESKLTDFLSKQYGVPAINLRDFEIDPEIIGLVPRQACLERRIIPVNRAGASLIIAMSDPSDFRAMEAITAMTGYQIEAVVASDAEIGAAIERYYPLP